MDTIRVTGLLQASPNRVFEAWLSSHEHALFTGKPAEIDPGIDGEYKVFRGQLTGKTLELKKNKLIVQSWRTREFPESAKDSHVEVHLKKRKDGSTEIDIRHSEIPTGLGTKYEQGWLDRYITPLRTYFSNPAARDAAPPPQEKKEPKKTASKKKAASKSSSSVTKKTATKAAARSTATEKKKVTKASAKSAPAKKTVAKKPAAKSAAPKKKVATKKLRQKRRSPRKRPRRKRRLRKKR